MLWCLSFIHYPTGNDKSLGNEGSFVAEKSHMTENCTFWNWRILEEKLSFYCKRNLFKREW